MAPSLTLRSSRKSPVYHRRFTTDRPLWTATLALGHVDGYPSGAVKGGQAFAKGRLYPVIGTVSASHTIIALGSEQSLSVGDAITVVGPDDPALHPNEVAKRAGWSEYNMLIHLRRRWRNAWCRSLRALGGNTW